MHTFWSWRWTALAIAFGLSAPAIRGEIITPDSIPNPPSAVSSVGGTPVYANNLVTTQYGGLGLYFVNAAITEFNNTPVWAPVVNTIPGSIAYGPSWGMGIDFVKPGTLTATAISSVTVDTFGLTGTPNLVVDSINGRQLNNIVPVLQSGPNGSQAWTFSGPGLSSFGISPSAPQTGAWGISEISYSPLAAPEPSSLVLAGLGVLGLVARLGWRRERLPRGNAACMTPLSSLR